MKTTSTSYKIASNLTYFLEVVICLYIWKDRDHRLPTYKMYQRDNQYLVFCKYFSFDGFWSPKTTWEWELKITIFREDFKKNRIIVVCYSLFGICLNAAPI